MQYMPSPMSQILTENMLMYYKIYELFSNYHSKLEVIYHFFIKLIINFKAKICKTVVLVRIH